RKAKQHREETKRIKILAQKLTVQFAFAANGLFIRPFATAEEVVREGNLQHHCVGGYTGDYADERSYLFCIRTEEAPDTPYYTLELDPKTGTVRQYRGYRNDAPTSGKPDPAAVAFVNKWVKSVVIPQYQKQDKKQAQTQIPA
ncbi:MAG: PcfJ domain-containing protein, partial [Angelakisella sp.]